MEEALANGV
jgi:hypothetical protein